MEDGGYLGSKRVAHPNRSYLGLTFGVVFSVAKSVHQKILFGVRLSCRSSALERGTCNLFPPYSNTEHFDHTNVITF